MKRLSLIILFLGSILNSLHAQGIPYLRNYPATEYMAHNQNFDVIAADDGTVYVANFEGLLYYDNADWRIIHSPGISRITAVFQDPNGVLWTGGYNYFGYLKIDQRGNLHMHPCNATTPFHGEVQWIWQENGNIFFLASNKEIYAVHNDTYQLAPGKSCPTSNRKNYAIDANIEITQVEDLEDGLQALSTNGDGVIFVDPDGRELFRITEQNGLCSNNVSHMDYNRHGLLWGATDNGIFCIAFPSIYMHFTSYEGLRGEVLSLKQLNGHLYAGTLSGLYRLESKKFLPVANITHACWQLANQGNTLLAATANGVYRITPDNQAARLTPNNTMSLLVEQDGSFYGGGIEGVYHYNNGQSKPLNDIEKVVKIVRDPSGSIWLQNLYGKLWRDKGSGVFEPFTQDGKDEISTLVDFGDKLMPISINTTTPIGYPAFSYHDTQDVTWLTDNKGKSLYAYKNGTRNAEQSAFVYPLMDYSVRAMLTDGNLLWIGGDKGINIRTLENNYHTQYWSALGANPSPLAWAMSALLASCRSFSK